MKKNINIQNLVRSHILGMKPYSSARLEYEGHDGIFLDANENPFGSVCGDNHNRYPDPLQTEVKKKIAALENVTPNQLFIGNGSDECIDVLIRAFCEPGKDKILVCPPVFSMYEHAAHAQNVGITSVLLKENFQLDVKAVKENMEDVKIIFLCSPNNPTGNLFHKSDIEEILDSFTGLVLIDEAYIDFSEEESWVGKLHEYQNLIVIKTFSKAYGMANARLGILYAHTEVIDFLNTIKLPYNVSEYSQHLAVQALNNIEKKNDFADALVAGRKFLYQEMKNIQLILKIYPSDANYILFKVEDPDAIYKYLVSKKVIIRNRSRMPLCEGCLRVSVGTPEENRKFINALKNYKA